MKTKLIASVLTGLLSVYAASAFAIDLPNYCKIDENSWIDFGHGTVNIRQKVFSKFKHCVRKYCMSVEKKALDDSEEAIFDGFADKMTGDFTKDMAFLNDKEKEIYSKVYLDSYSRRDKGHNWTTFEFKPETDEIIDKSHDVGKSPKKIQYIADNASDEEWAGKKEKRGQEIKQEKEREEEERMKKWKENQKAREALNAKREEELKREKVRQREEKQKEIEEELARQNKVENLTGEEKDKEIKEYCQKKWPSGRYPDSYRTCIKSEAFTKKLPNAGTDSTGQGCQNQYGDECGTQYDRDADGYTKKT